MRVSKYFTSITKTTPTSSSPGFTLVMFEAEDWVNYEELKYFYSPPVREQHHMYPMVDGSALCLRL